MKVNTRRSLNYEHVVEHLKNRLLNGELSPGDRLPTVVGLAEELGVGRASVREAYRMMEKEGILEVTQGRGTFISKSSISGAGTLRQINYSEQRPMAEMIEAWRILKPEVAYLAAQRATPSEVAAIIEAAQSMKNVASPGEEFHRLDFRFDELLFAACHNQTLSRILYSLHDLISKCTHELSNKVPGHMEKCIKYHNLIAMAIQENSPDAARAFMLQHVADVEQDLPRLNERISRE